MPTRCLSRYILNHYRSMCQLLSRDLSSFCTRIKWKFLLFTGRAAGSQLRQATCAPVDTIVSLIPADERDPTVFYFPSCVLVKQCGGCCAHSGTSCSPTSEEEKQMTIKKTKFAGGSKLQPMGEVTVTVKEHKKCKCQCKKTASDCNSLQRFISGQCRCECINALDAEECTKVSTTNIFD